MSSSESSTSTVIERVQSFVSEHRRAILLGTAVVVAAGGVAYYAASTSRRPDDDFEGGRTRTKDKKKSKSGKKRKSLKDPDGPLLEEITPPQAKTALPEESAAKSRVELQDDPLSASSASSHL